MADASVDFHKESQVDGAVDGEDIGRRDIHLFRQEGKEPLVGTFFDLQADGLAALPLLQFVLDLLEQVFHFVLVHAQVCVAHDPVGIGADHIVVEEELCHVGPDDFLQQDDPDLPFFAFRKEDHSGQDAGHLDGGIFIGLLLGLFFLLFLLFPVEDAGAGVDLPGQKGADVQTLVADQRERPGGVDGHGRQDRIDIALEIPVRIGPFVLGQFLKASQDIDLIVPKARQQLVVESPVLLLHEEMGILQDGGQLFAGGHARNVLLLISRMLLVLEGGHTHHKELIQVGRGNGEEFQSLQQGIVLAPGLGKASSVELQPAQLSVDIVLRISEILFFLCHCHCIPLLP